MAVGSFTTKGEMDVAAGRAYRNMRDALTLVGDFKYWLDTQSDSQLISLGYVQADVDTVRSAYTDLEKLHQIYLGNQTQSSTYDFRTFAKVLG